MAVVQEPVSKVIDETSDVSVDELVEDVENQDVEEEVESDEIEDDVEDADGAEKSQKKVAPLTPEEEKARAKKAKKEAKKTKKQLEKAATADYKRNAAVNRSYRKEQYRMKKFDAGNADIKEAAKNDDVVGVLVGALGLGEHELSEKRKERANRLQNKRMENAAMQQLKKNPGSMAKVLEKQLDQDAMQDMYMS